MAQAPAETTSSTVLMPLLNSERSAELLAAGNELRRFLMTYKFGMDEMLTKINILREELRSNDDDSCPIEHVASRLKTVDSLATKLQRKGVEMDPQAVRKSIHDVAGIRIVCSFVSDVYLVADMLTSQPDVQLVTAKDYITKPKANGYKSLHLIVETPVHMSDRVVMVPVELQLRTVAMDFWASLEHKIFYKYDGDIPATLREELTEAAHVADRLDATMERLHHEVRAAGSLT